ncbi:MAG TPA: sulfatase-like hydrolase/transferase [Chryseosolibacter sp.]|nr:sulfatase-like hydrolase/transferase [Chryseosolibacter sp.]
MKKPIVLVIFLVCGPGIFAQAPSGNISKGKKPNILFILIDDLGYADLGCYGNEELKTPAIDQLAREGIRFTQYYAGAPICSPSRVAVFTGQYPPRWEISSYIDSRAKNQERGMRDFLDRQALSIAKILSAAGYYTAHIGKWHMGGGRDVGDAPLITEYGFDESVTQFEGLGERYLATYEILNLKDSTRQLEKSSASLGRGEVHWEKRYHITERFADRSIIAMANAQKAGKPFFIHLWPDDVHTPLEPSPANRGNGSKHDRYMGVVTELDQQLGRVFNFIRKDPALAGNTMIVVTSDNGPEPGAGSAGNLRSTKGSLYEGGIREPFIVWFPARIPVNRRGTTNDENVIVGMDLPPSFAALAGVAKSHPFDGIDVSDAFVGKPLPKRKQPIMWQRPPDRKMVEGTPQPDLAIREGNFKMLINTDSTGVELYDISKDEAESKNVAAQHPDIVKALSDQLLEWYASMPGRK